MIGRRVPPAYAPVRPLAWLPSGRGRPRPRLAERLRSRLDAEEVILVGSGTEALRLAVRAAFRLGAAADSNRRGRDAVVAMPAFTCYDVAAAVLAETSRVACFDIDPVTLSPDPSSVGRVLAGGAAVLVVSPLYGVPVPWEWLREAAAGAGATLIEDAAQGHGATWLGSPLGAIADLSVISFARGKGWTGGAGGAVLGRGEGADSLRALDPIAPSTPARGGSVALGALAQWALGSPPFYGLPAAVPWLRLGETVYRPAAEPREMPASAARMALGTEAAADAEAAIRRGRAAWFRRRLDPRIMVPVPEGAVAGDLRLPVRVRGGLSALPGSAVELGVAPTYPRSLPELPAVRSAVQGPETDWPGAEALARDLITLPTHSLLRRNDAERLLRFLHEPERNRIAEAPTTARSAFGAAGHAGCHGEEA